MIDREPDRVGSGAPRGLLTRVNDRIELTLAYAAGACLASFTVVVAVDVVYRQILAQPLLWPSEWSVMTFIWSVLLGASVAARRQSHFVVDALPTMPVRLDRALQILVALLTILFALVLIYYGYHVTLSGLRRRTPMVGYSLFYVYVAFPLAGSAIMLFAIEHLLRLLRGQPASPHAEDDG
jgi:TRAP-type transport system small permease protein